MVTCRGRPAAESCPHCLNKKYPCNLCGVGNTANNYDDWLDSTGTEMSWDSQATLTLGQEFDVTAFLDTNHAGAYRYFSRRFFGRSFFHHMN